MKKENNSKEKHLLLDIKNILKQMHKLLVILTLIGIPICSALILIVLKLII